MSAADSFKLSNKGLSYRFGVLKLRIGEKLIIYSGDQGQPRLYPVPQGQRSAWPVDVVPWPPSPAQRPGAAPGSRKGRGCWATAGARPGTCPRALTLGRTSTWPQHRVWDTAHGPGVQREASQVATEEAAALCSSSLSTLCQPSLCSSVCTEAGPVPLSLFSLQLLWKAKFH